MAATQVTADVIKDGTITATKLAPGVLDVGGIEWQTNSKTSNFNATSGEGYFVDTSSSAITVTLPSTPTVGDLIAFADFGSSFQTNNLTITSAKKIIGSDSDQVLSQQNQALRIVFSGDTKGWLIASSANEGTTATSEPVVEMRALLIGGGGGGGYGAHSHTNYNAIGGGGGAGEFLDKPNIAIETGSDYTVTVGTPGAQNNNGTSTSIIADSGASNTFDYEVFGGGHGGYYGDLTGDTGGSSGGAGINRFPIGGSQSSVSETKNEGDLGSRANQGGNSYKYSNYNTSAGGGGGAGADGNAGSVNYPNGGNGGDGYASDITGSDVTYAGGGGGGCGESNRTVGTGGSGGGGGPDSAGSANTGSGGSGNHWNASGYAGGSGVIILKYPDSLAISETTNPNVLIMSTDSSSVSGFNITTITAGTNGTIQFN